MLEEPSTLPSRRRWVKAVTTTKPLLEHDTQQIGGVFAGVEHRDDIGRGRRHANNTTCALMRNQYGEADAACGMAL